MSKEKNREEKITRKKEKRENGYIHVNMLM